MKESINIGIAEDHPLVRQGLVSALKPHKNINVLFEVANGKELLEQLKVVKPHIILLDIEMPVMRAQEVLERMSGKYPKIKVIIISAFFQKDYIIECFKAGAKAFLPKADRIETVLEAIYSVYEKGIYADAEVTKILANEIMATAKSTKSQRFTESELEVLDLIAKGNTRKKVAQLLAVKPETVNFHMDNIMRKTGIHNTPELIAFAIKNKLINPTNL